MKKENISGSEALIHCLLEEGVELIYGYPGGAIMPFYDELYKFQDHINHVLVRHEQGASHAAQGFARVSGQVGVPTKPGEIMVYQATIQDDYEIHIFTMTPWQ